MCVDHDSPGRGTGDGASPGERDGRPIKPAADDRRHTAQGMLMAFSIVSALFDPRAHR